MRGRLTAVAAVVVLVGAGVLLGSSLSQFGSSPPTPRPETLAPEGVRVRVEVLNGGGLDGAARDATGRLRDGGFDVVFFGNAGAFGRDSSLVLARTDDASVARAVADVLGIRNVRVEPDSNLYLDVSVVLGADWVPTAKTEADARASRAWWDPRRWFGR